MSVTMGSSDVFKKVGVIIFIAVLSAVTVFSIILVNKISSDDEPPEWFETYISELVLLDLDNFSSPSEIPAEKLIAFGIWKCLRSDLDAVKYPVDDEGKRYISSADVFSKINEYFEITKPVKPVSSPPFIYLKNTDRFSIPVYGKELGYYPKVKKITFPKEGYTILDVAYYNSDYFTDSENESAYIKKSVLITLKGAKGKYKFISLVKKG